MAAYLAFKSITTGETIEGRGHIKLDEELARAFDSEPDPVQWFRFWMDRIGFSLAVSNDYAKAREHWQDSPDQIELLDYLEKHYTLACYGGR